jgi:alpha-tubulin suppressor-like RCC1 family protein
VRASLWIFGSLSLGLAVAVACRKQARVEGDAAPPASSTLPLRVRAIAVSGGVACALSADGRLACWGSSGALELGFRPEETCIVTVGEERFARPCRGTPTLVPGLPPVSAVAQGGGHACAIDRTARVHCWGSADSGQVGFTASARCELYGGRQGQCTPPALVPALTGIRQVTLGVAHSCALGIAGDVWCWGENRYRQLGFPASNVCPSAFGTESCEPRPRRVPGLGAARQLSAGHDHTCALVEDGTVRCWGHNVMGQLGDGTTVTRATPAPVRGLSRVSSVAAGSQHTARCTGTAA